MSQQGLQFYMCYFSTVFSHSSFSWSQGYRVVLCPSWCCVQAGEPCTAFHGGSRERGLHNHREGKFLCENHVLSWVHCDSHQNLCGDMSELLPLHLSSAAKITASSAPRSVVPGLSEGSHYIQVTPRTVMCVTEDLTCQTPRGCSCGQCYLLGFQLSFKCNLVIF